MKLIKAYLEDLWLEGHACVTDLMIPLASYKCRRLVRFDRPSGREPVKELFAKPLHEYDDEEFGCNSIMQLLVGPSHHVMSVVRIACNWRV